MPFTAEQELRFAALYAEVAAVKDDLKIVRIVDSMLELLVASGEAQVKHIGLTRVVPHSANRSGSLMEVRQVYTKGSKILGVGFSLTRCDAKRAVAFQVKPGDVRGVTSFVEYAKESPYLATFDAATVEAASVGCGHLNQFLACIQQECEVPPEFHGHADLFGSLGGTKLDRHLLCKAQDPQFATTLEQGLKWTFIPYKFEQLYPKLPHFIQKALNSEHHIGEGETWDEQLLGIARTIVEHFKDAKKTNIDYNKIARATLASKPPRATDVPSHLAFCKKWGGGSSQQFVLDICEFVKLAPGACIVSSSTFDAICRLKLPSDCMCPQFMAAVVKCAACRGASRNGVSIHVVENDLKGLLRNIPAMQEANTFMVKAREIQQELGTSKATVVARGTMECDMVDYLLNKMPKADRDATSLAQISRCRCESLWKLVQAIFEIYPRQRSGAIDALCLFQTIVWYLLLKFWDGCTADWHATGLAHIGCCLRSCSWRFL